MFKLKNKRNYLHGFLINIQPTLISLWNLKDFKCNLKCISSKTLLISVIKASCLVLENPTKHRIHELCHIQYFFDSGRFSFCRKDVIYLKRITGMMLVAVRETVKFTNWKFHLENDLNKWIKSGFRLDVPSRTSSEQMNCDLASYTFWPLAPFLSLKNDLGSVGLCFDTCNAKHVSVCPVWIILLSYALTLSLCLCLSVCVSV